MKRLTKRSRTLRRPRAALGALVLASGLAAHGTAARADQAADPAAATTAEPASPAAEGADDQPARYSLHFQGTYTTMGHPRFSSSIPDGPQSMKAQEQMAETADVTMFAGLRLGALELYFNPEMDQGFGPSNTFGVAGYPTAEAYKLGQYAPYYRTQRLFGRYVLGLGGAREAVEDGPNQIAGSRDADNVTFTFGKFSVVDIFDTNSYAHDPRADFLNWSMVDMGAFDYAGDAWGYTYGGAAEWNQSWWTLRGGVFDMSRQPGNKYLTRGFGQYQAVTEAEERHQIGGNPGKVKALFFLTSADMGSYADAVNLYNQTGAGPDTALVRHHQLQPGGGINLEQQIMPGLGSFLRASMNSGTRETFDFTDIHRSLSGGLSLKGDRWDRPDDTVGLGGAINAISSVAHRYFADGGTGVLIGDGQLPSFASEKVIEAYYKATVVSGIAVSMDYQHLVDPAYDAARGPIDFFAVRLHAEY